jgi:hypothetical protein
MKTFFKGLVFLIACVNHFTYANHNVNHFFLNYGRVFLKQIQLHSNSFQVGFGKIPLNGITDYIVNWLMRSNLF